MTLVVKSIFDGVLAGNVRDVEMLVHVALEQGLDVETILNESLISAMEEVGARFESGDMFVPEMLVAAKAMKAGLVIIQPRLVASGVKYLGRVVIGTVKGDLHDIGKNLVSMMLEGSGFEVIDLGTDVAPDRFAAAAREHEADIVAMSALLTTTMQQMQKGVEAIEGIGVRKQVRIMIGGAPVTEAFAKKIEADGYAPDASRGVSLARSLMQD